MGGRGSQSDPGLSESLRGAYPGPFTPFEKYFAPQVGLLMWVRVLESSPYVAAVLFTPQNLSPVLLPVKSLRHTYTLVELVQIGLRESKALSILEFFGSV